MSVLDRIACRQGRRDEIPNQELARNLAADEDQAGIREIAENLWSRDPNIRSDCLKVLYEIGYLRPELGAPYAGDFLKLLRSRNNRLVWGAMIGLSTIAGLAADEIYPHVAEIQRTMAEGSVITVDAGILTLARLAASGEERRAALIPYLLEHLRTCRPKDVPQHAEKIVVAITPAYRAPFIATLQSRMPLMAPAQAARLKKVIRQVEAL
jgi:hypothetical protein